MGKTYVGRRERMTMDDWRGLGWDEQDAAELAKSDRTTVRVVVVTDDGVAPLAHHVRHSPSGFEWGYGGSGPAELARCILLDHYGVEGDDGMGFEPSRLPVGYQDFKFEVIAKLPRDAAWSISSELIEEWAKDRV